METNELQFDEGDRMELSRFRRVVKEKNAGQVDRDITFLREMGMWEVKLYEPRLVDVINTFEFKREDAAKAAVQYATDLNEQAS